MTEDELEKAMRLKTDITQLNATLLEYQKYEVDKKGAYFIYQKGSGSKKDLRVDPINIQSLILKSINLLKLDLEILKNKFAKL